MAFTTINKSGDYFNTKLYTGNGGTQSITGVGFQPDFTWLKGRSFADYHVVNDAVRGATKSIYPNDTSSEGTQTNGLTSFDSDGFSIGNWSNINPNGGTLASWNWKANGTGSANTDGSITSTVSANTTAGFSIATFTTLNSTISTVGHGLGVVPDMYIVKTRANSNGWFVYHKDIGNTKFLRLETTDAETTNAMWNNTSPTSDVFTINANNFGASTSVAYCFNDVQGYSKFGSYVGNGNVDGTFVYTGFKPAWLLRKRTDQGAASTWLIHDSKRGVNTNAVRLRAELPDAESSGNEVDLLSNGFKIRETGGYGNASGSPYIYMAFASAPLVGSNNVPCTAR